MCRFQVNTGMRYGEMVALDYEKHIDFENNAITIERTYSQHTKSFDTPKNGKSRTITVKPDLMAMIQRLIYEDKIKMIRHGLDKNNTLLFRSLFDKPLSITTMNYRLKQIHIEGKILSTHIFRHTFITHMVEAKVPSRQIAEYVDNSTEMIERVYTHFSEKMKNELSEAVQVMKFMWQMPPVCPLWYKINQNNVTNIVSSTSLYTCFTLLNNDYKGLLTNRNLDFTQRSAGYDLLTFAKFRLIEMILPLFCPF